MSNLIKTTNFLFISIFKNPKTYIFNFLISTLFPIAVFYLWVLLGDNFLYPSNIYGIISISIIMSAFFLTNQFITWKNTILFERIRISGKNKITVIFSLIISFLAVITITFLLSYAFIVAFIKIQNNSFYIKMLNDIDWYIYIYLFIFTLFSEVILILIFLMFSQFSNNGKMNKINVIILFIFILIFSDSVIISNYANDIKVFEVLGYLNPIKYSNWTCFYFVTYSFIDMEGIFQIINFNNKGFDYNLFHNQYITISMSIVLIVGLTLGNLSIFKWNSKG